MSRVVALWGRPAVDADGLELLRWLVAALAAGRPVTLVDLVAADLLGDGLVDEAEDLRDALVAHGAVFVRLDEGCELDALIATAGVVHRLAPPARGGMPLLLPVGAGPAPTASDLLGAGQVVCAPR